MSADPYLDALLANKARVDAYGKPPGLPPALAALIDQARANPLQNTGLTGPPGPALRVAEQVASAVGGAFGIPVGVVVGLANNAQNQPVVNPPGFIAGVGQVQGGGGFRTQGDSVVADTVSHQAKPPSGTRPGVFKRLEHWLAVNVFGGLGGY